MSAPTASRDTIHEAEWAIAWTCHAGEHAWVREHEFASDSPTKSPRVPAGWHLVAYAIDAPRRPRPLLGVSSRRVWFRKDADPDVYGDHDWPVEAVDPASIRPRQASRSMGQPLDEVGS